MLQAERQRDLGSILGRVDTFILTSKRPHRIRGPTQPIVLNGSRRLLSQGTKQPRREATHLYVAPTVQMSGATPPLPHISQYAKRL